MPEQVHDIPPAPRQLTPASRRRLSKQLRRTSTAFLITYVLLSLGMVVTVGVLGGTNDWLLTLHHETANGIAESAGHPSGGSYVVAYTFMTPDGGGHRGYCYTDDADLVWSLRPGGAVNVQHLPGEPRVSRIKGMRHSPSSLRRFLPSFLWGAVLIGAFVAFVAAAYQRRRQLCERGVPTCGELLAPGRLERAFTRKLVTRGTWRWPPVHYRFVDGTARRHLGAMNTTGHAVRLEPGDEVTVIYDPLDPRRSICLEAFGLEFVPKTDSTGSPDQHDPFRPAPSACCGPGR